MSEGTEMFIRLRSIITLCILGAVAALAAGFATNGLGGSVFWAQSVSGPPWGPPVIGNKVLLSSSAYNDAFGFSVAVSADESTIVVGAPTDGAGAIYVFTKPSGGWGGGTTPTSVKITGTVLNGQSIGGFGHAVGVSRDGSTIVVGAPRTNYSFTTNAGAAFVLTRPATGWAAGAAGARIRINGHNVEDRTGTSVAVSEDGSTVVIGTPWRDASVNPDRGRADVFTKPGSGWGHGDNQTLNAARLGRTTNRELFGHSVSVSANGDTVVVGTNPTSGDETVYVYPRPSSGWTRTGTASTPVFLNKETPRSGTDRFGEEGLAISGDGNTIVVGAKGVGNGTAYVFAKPTAGWVTTTTAARLTASDGATLYSFGESVSVNNDGSMIAIGEPDRGGTASDRGAVHLFARPVGGKWLTTDTADPLSVSLPDEMTRGERGMHRGLSIGGNVVGVGAWVTGRNQTAAWVYNTMPEPGPTATPTITPTPTETPLPTATSIPTSTPIGGGDDGEGGEGEGEGEDVTPTVTPTPRPTSTPEPPRPEVGLSTNFLTFTAARGGDSPPSQTFTVWNAERQTEMPFTVSSDTSWLSFSPRSASSNSPQARVTVRVSANASGLAAGTYRGRITISAPAAENTPRMVFVTLNVNGPTTAMTPTSTPEPTQITTDDSTVQVAVPAAAAPPSNVEIRLTKLDADAPGAPPADQERVVLAAELDTYASGSNTPTPMTYSPGVDLRFALPASDSAACAEGRVRVYRVSGDEWTLLQHRCETDDSGAVWAVSTLTNFSTYVMTIDDTPATPTPEPTAPPTATPVPTATSVPTAVPTATPRPATATPVPTAIPTATPRPATATPVPTATRTPTAIPTATPRPATATPRPTATSVPTATPVPATATPMPAATFTPVPPATAVTQAVATSTPAPEVEDGGGLNMGLIIVVVLVVVIAGAAAAVLYARRGGMGAG